MVHVHSVEDLNRRWKASAALPNLETEAAYDPMDMDTVCCRGAAPIRAHQMEIGAFASKVPPVPVGMAGDLGRKNTCCYTCRIRN